MFKVVFKFNSQHPFNNFFCSNFCFITSESHFGIIHNNPKVITGPISIEVHHLPNMDLTISSVSKLTWPTYFFYK